MSGGEVFGQCLTLLWQHEGGYQCDARDAGNWTRGRVGAGQLRGTKFGIAAAAYPTLEVARLTREEATAIYARDYWAPIAGEELPPVLAMVVFDAAVNSGVHRALGWLQAALGVQVDGVAGAVTVSAAQVCDARAVAREFCRRRLAFLQGLRGWRDFGKGWEQRVEGTLAAALALEVAG